MQSRENLRHTGISLQAKFTHSAKGFTASSTDHSEFFCMAETTQHSLLRRDFKDHVVIPAFPVLAGTQQCWLCLVGVLFPQSSGQQVRRQAAPKMFRIAKFTQKRYLV